MKRITNTVLHLLFLLIAILFAGPVGAQSAEPITLYVNQNHPAAADTNLGTVASPFLTVGAAAALAINNRTQNIATRIVIAPGVYREEIYLNGEGSAYNPAISFEAQFPGMTTISGADVWTDWSPSADQPEIYVHHWPFDWGLYNNPWTEVEMGPLAQRRELIFVNGAWMRQVLSREELTEGTFFIAEDTDTAYLYPADETDMTTAVVEVSPRGTIFEFKSIANITVHGLVMRHASSPLGIGALRIIQSQDIVIEDSQLLWNNWIGLDIIESTGVTVRRTIANHNGERGMGGRHSSNLLFEDVENSYNNWRGDLGNFYTWDAGQKFLGLRDATFRRYRAVGNQATGLWIDFDNENILIENAYICDNYLTGLYIEANQGPITVRDSIICGTRVDSSRDTSHYLDAGVFITNSQQVTLEGNLICNNDYAQIRLAGAPSPQREVNNRLTGEVQMLRTENLTLSNNTIIAVSPEQFLFQTPQESGTPDWSHLLDTLQQNTNTWFSVENATPFHIEGSSLDFDAWQARTGANAGSVFALPASSILADCALN